MRICLLTEYFNPDGYGGVASMMPMLAQRLCARYPEVSIDVIASRNLYRGEEHALSRFEVWEGIQVYRLATPRSNQPSLKRRLLAGCFFTTCAWAKLMTLPPYDLLLVGTNPPMIPLAARGIGVWKHTRYVYLIHDLFPDVALALGVLPADHPVTRMAKRAQTTWLHGAARVVAIGRCMRDYLREQYQLPAERLTVIPNWADARAITPLAKNTRFRACHGLTGFVLLYAGNFGQYQDFDTLLDAARQLYCAGTRDITLVFVGEGSRQEYIAERIAREGIANVRLFPFVPAEDYPDLLASADASLVTLEPGAEQVGVPSKFYNILASGRPVLATLSARSEVARVLEEAHCGLWVEPKDIAGLAAAILQLARSPRRCEQMGQQARATLVRSYTLDNAAERFQRLFNEVIDEKAPAKARQESTITPRLSQ